MSAQDLLGTPSQTDVSESAELALLNVPSSTQLRPVFEGNNISFAIGFKHINYVAEAAVIAHFRRAGLAVGHMFEQYGLGFDVIEIGSRLAALLHVDDEATCEVKPATKDGDRHLTFKVTMFVDRDGFQTKAATSTVKVVLRIDDKVKPLQPIPAGLERFAVPRLGTSAPQPLAATPVTTTDFSAGRGTSVDPVLAELTAGQNAFGWKWRVPYFYCHFNERMQMSAFLRVMEEVVDLFLADRGLPIKTVLDERNWIPVVTQSKIELLDEVLMEEDLYTVYTVENVFKDMLYTSRMDCYVVRDGQLVHTATGGITHGYLTERAQNDWVMASFDDYAKRAFNNEPQPTA